MTDRSPLHVYRWENGNVMVFDQFGEQMPDLQGRFEEVREQVEAASTEETVFRGWFHPVPGSRFREAVDDVREPRDR